LGILEKGPFLAIDPRPVPLQLERGNREDVPERMEDFVAEEFALAGRAETPAMFLEKMGVGIGRGACRVVLGVHLERMLLTPPPEGVTDVEIGRGDRGAGGHGSRAVGFVVDTAGHQRGEAVRDELADEGDTAVVAVAEVKTKVYFREVSVTGPGESEHAGVEEVESDEGDVGGGVRIAGEAVEGASGGEAGQEAFSGDGIGEEEEVGPPGGEEDSHGKSWGLGQAERR
jgi:hypothetical protein